MKVNTLFGVVALLATVRTVNAALCTTTAITAAGNCDCAGGITSTAVSSGTNQWTVAAGSNIYGTLTWVAGSLSIAQCTDIMPGYQVATAVPSGSAITPSTAQATTGITACPSGSYCPQATTKVTYSSGNIDAIAASAATACPTGTTNALSGTTNAALIGIAAVDATVCDDLAPGYAILSNIALQSSARDITALTTGITACAPNFYCPGVALGLNPGGGSNGITAGTTGSTFTWTAITAVAAVACPSVSTLTGTSPAGSSGVTACLTPAGAYVNTFTSAAGGATIAYCPAHYYCPGSVAMTATNAGSTACPINSGGTLGTTGSLNAAVATVATAAAKSTVSSCQLAAGFYVSSYTAASGSTPASATVAICPANSYCPGYVNTANSVFVTYVVSGTGVGAVACPTVSVLGDASSVLASASNTAITSCTIDPGYYQTGFTAATSTALASAPVAVCTTNYYCAGQLPIATTVSNSNYGATACPKASTVGDASYTPNPGTSSNAISDCYTKPGYYISAVASASGTAGTSNYVPITGTGALCQVNEYCPGAYQVPTSTPTGSVGGTPWTVGNDGSIPCPGSAVAQTTLSVAVAATAATANNAVTDCIIPAGYYVSTLQGSPVASSTIGALTACPTGASCVGGIWSDVLGYGITSILANYVVTSVSSGVPVVATCGTSPVLGTSCTGSTGANLLTIGYGGVVSNTDYYVSAAGTTSACPAAPCSLGQSLTTAGGSSIPSGYYLGGASGAVTQCPTGATCTGAPGANATSLAFGATANAGYYVSTAATSSAVAVVTACPATGATCAGSQSLATKGGIVITAGYYVSGATSSVVTVAACPTGASCAGATGSNAFTAGYGGLTLAGYWLSGAYSAGVSAITVSACATAGTGFNAADKCAPGVALTATAPSGIAVAGATPAVVVAGYYMASGSSASTAVYALCATGVTCAGGDAGVLYSGATANAGYYVSAAGLVSACPTGAACTLTTQSLSMPGGISNIYPGYMATAVINGNAVAVSACPTGAVCSGDNSPNSNSDLPYSNAYSLAGYYVSAAGTVSPCPAASTCSGSGSVSGMPLSSPGGGTVMAGFYVATAGSAPALCPSGSYCPGGGNLGLAGGSFACPVNSTLLGCNDYVDNAPASTTVSSSPVSVAPAPVTTTVTPAAVTVTPAAVTVTPASQPISINVPAPVISAAPTRSSTLVLVLAALAALAAF